MKKDVGELDTSVKELKEKIADRSKRHSQYEINFVMSHNNIICCFFDKLLLLTDTAFNPLYIYETNSYINACTISDTAKYILCQTANNRKNDEDSGATIIIDVKSETVLSKKSIETGWKGIRHLFIDENNMTFFAYYDDKQVQYDFNCNLLSEKSVAAKVTITPQGQKTMYDKAREKIYADKDWEKELDKKNREKAGIE